MPLNARSKGKRGELELAAYLRSHGYKARRGRQFSGSPDSPDVVGIPNIHVECKRVESGNLYKWLEQAIRDAGDKIPVVMHRRNNKEWVAILPLKNFMKLIGENDDDNGGGEAVHQVCGLRGDP